ncbi:Na(+)/H(+) exchange regulatory cofactor NHE-RF2-like isoform X2 [Girardinichthys multiradiatus]|uniref:Na(+)/H(+) exchange regulatory cofactor NHE-RF2-like isoform X2 n=1 Tax=Girardinichthys multiradiatus TaxID=208333 RepID=UPI001FAD3CDA|nr:Na(+)/H(+) exchange regulatory cofactor NHE-RF2-like isoform X2 [Girardinichthys multiradiatus]
MANERKPRLCIIAKGENGYGFHLHGEKGKSGQFIRKVEPGSTAEASGMRAGDRVVAVNGVNVERVTHHQVVQRIKAVENETRLLVVDQETYESLRSLHLTATEEMAILVTEAVPAASSPPASPLSAPSSTPSSPTKKRQNGSVSKQGGQVQKPTRRSPSKAAKKVNGVNIEGMRHTEVVAFIKKGGDETWLLVVDPETDEHFKRTGVVPTISHVNDYDGPSISNGSPSPQINGSSTTQSIRSTHSDLSSQGNSTQLADDDGSQLMDPFAEIGLRLSATAAEEKMKIHAKEKKKAPQMDWMKKYELFSNF